MIPLGYTWGYINLKWHRIIDIDKFLPISKVWTQPWKKGVTDTYQIKLIDEETMVNSVKGFFEVYKDNTNLITLFNTVKQVCSKSNIASGRRLSWSEVML